MIFVLSFWMISWDRLHTENLLELSIPTVHDLQMSYQGYYILHITYDILHITVL